MKSSLLHSTLVLALALSADAATVVMTPPIPYRSILDSPYYNQNLSRRWPTVKAPVSHP